MTVAAGPCLPGCGRHGTCATQLGPGLATVARCSCAAGWRGPLCGDPTTATSDYTQLTVRLVLVLTNLSMVPATMLSLYRSEEVSLKFRGNIHNIPPPTGGTTRSAWCTGCSWWRPACTRPARARAGRGRVSATPPRCATPTPSPRCSPCGSPCSPWRTSRPPSGQPTTRHIYTFLHTYLHISTRVSPPRSVLHLTGGVTIAAAAQAPRPQLVGGAVLAASLGLTLVSWLAHSVRTRACSPSSKVSLVNSLLQTYLH